MKQGFQIKIFISAFLGVMIVVLLFGYSKYKSTVKNSFTRLFPPHVLTNFNVVDLKYNSYYIAGVSSKSIFFGNYMAPDNLVIIDQDLRDSQLVVFDVPEEDKIVWGKIRVMVDYPNVFMCEGVTPVILHTQLPFTKMKKIDMDTLHFDHIWHPVTNSSLIVRVYDDQKKQNVLSKINLGQRQVEGQPGVLEKQIDGKFCTDGSLMFDNQLKRVVYVYNYRNQFIVTDTNLKVVHRSRTIDNTTYAKISLDTIHSEKRVTFSAPPLMVNKRACTSDGLLYINSGLCAQNEDAVTFRESSVLDVYDLSNGNYKYSFYLPKYKDQKLRYLRVANKKIFLLYENYLVTYDLSV
jgi:hypothetical protein